MKVFVRLDVYFCICHLPPSPTSPPTSINAALPLHLSLIYIAMTPVSVTPAPCCEFHLSRKTSGDCYANGYVVGLVQGGGGQKKKWQCLYPRVCWEERRKNTRGEKNEDSKREDKNGWGSKHINNAGKSQKGMIEWSFEHMFTGIKAAVSRWSIPAGCEVHSLISQEETRVCITFYEALCHIQSWASRCKNITKISWSSGF